MQLQAWQNSSPAAGAVFLDTLVMAKPANPLSLQHDWSLLDLSTALSEMTALLLKFGMPDGGNLEPVFFARVSYS